MLAVLCFVTRSFTFVRSCAILVPSRPVSSGGRAMLSRGRTMRARQVLMLLIGIRPVTAHTDVGAPGVREGRVRCEICPRAQVFRIARTSSRV